MAPLPIEVELTAWDNQNATSGGLSRIDAAISSRMASFTLPTNFSALAITAGGAVTAGTVSDKTGYTLAGTTDANVVSVAAAASNIKKNTALANFMFLMTDSTTHAPKTGVAVTATRSLDGAAFGACANAVSEIGNGWYKINLAAADLNGNNVALRFTGAASDDRNISIVTQP